VPGPLLYVVIHQFTLFLLMRAVLLYCLIAPTRNGNA